MLTYYSISKRHFFTTYILILVVQYCSNLISDELIISKSGAYCWFQDPRAVYLEGKFKRTYLGWVTSKGELQIGYIDHNTKETKTHTLKKFWDIDDHNVPSILVLPNKTLMVFYTKHNKDNIYACKALSSEDITVWGEEIIVAKMPKVTYSHPVYLSEEKRFYVFWRGESWKPTFSTSQDGVSWSEPKILFQDTGKESGDIRPYLKVVSNNKDEIHFAFTDGHPRNEEFNSIYYAYYRKGKFYTANGVEIGDSEALPIPHSKCDVVYDAKKGGGRAWVWDIALDRDGKPVIAFARMPSETKHYYCYGRWTGEKWEVSTITFAGKWFPQTPEGTKEPEPHYSGGISLNHYNPDEVALSREVGNTFEIELWKTVDKGKSWQSHPITKNSKCLNVRPLIPWGYKGEKKHIIWMKGEYNHYTRFNTSIVCTLN
ncbi:MAG: BNR repeat-containing protein [Candidatus Hydrogenedentes bacterium]|nr:BNR repeat-containing protein [Candidatus Hydrogenedentota bacterium]